VRSKLGSTVINCADLETMTTFWSETLSLSPSSRDADDDFRVLRGSWGNLSLQVSDTPVTARDQMHLDLFTDEQSSEVERLAGLGATAVRAHHDPDDDYVVMRDPEGNEFCICAVKPPPRSYVAVVGPSASSLASDDNRESVLAVAYEVGRLLAQRRIVVLCGGGTGVMGAVADGVASASGISIGILPGFDRADAHPALSFAVPTGLGELRNGLLVRAADAIIAVGCSWGTLSEIALGMRTGLPVVSVAGWDLPAGVVRHESPADAVTAALG
jgi:uncharacterized protein (TIGR00725 family)